jgi:hypothetical protein
MSAAETAAKSAVATVGARKRPGLGRSVSPALDFRKFLNGFKVPGVDLESIADARQADVKAIKLANRRVHEGMKALERRQAWTLRDAVIEWRGAIRNLNAVDGSDLAALRTDLAMRATQRALADVQELAETWVRSQAELSLPVRGRLRDAK